MADFERVIKSYQTVLAPWYVQAAKNLSKMGESMMFKELIAAAEQYISKK